MSDIEKYNPEHVAELVDEGQSFCDRCGLPAVTVTRYGADTMKGDVWAAEKVCARCLARKNA